MGAKFSKARKGKKGADALTDGFEMVESPKKQAKLSRKNVSRRGVLGSKKKQKRLSTIPPSEPEDKNIMPPPLVEHEAPAHDLDSATEDGDGHGHGAGEEHMQPNPAYPHEVDPGERGLRIGDHGLGNRLMKFAARGQAEFHDEHGDLMGNIQSHDYADPAHAYGHSTEHGYSQAENPHFSQQDYPEDQIHDAMSQEDARSYAQSLNEFQGQGQSFGQAGTFANGGGHDHGGPYDQNVQGLHHADYDPSGDVPSQLLHDAASVIRGKHLSRAQMFEDAKKSVEYILSQMDEEHSHGLRSALIRDAMKGVELYLNSPDGLSARRPSDKSFLSHLVGHCVGPGQHIFQAGRNQKYKRDGFKDYARAIKRHRIQPRDHNCIFWDKATNSLRRRDPGQKHHPDHALYTPSRMAGGSQVQAQDVQNDSEYICPVTIGVPGVTLDLDFDTGSSDLWVWSSETRANRAALRQHDIYNPRKSRTSNKLDGVTWSISYADGSNASGDIHLDVVKIGQVTIRRQAVEVAENVSSSFLDSQSDGILGLAFHRLNTATTKQKTPMENMIEQKLLKDPIFTVKLDKGDSNGFYTFGYINKPKNSSQLYWTRIITDNGYWEFRSHYMKFGDQVYNRLRNTAILDTGTTLVLLHDTFIHLIYSSIPGAHLDSDYGGYVFPTNTKIPPLSFCVGDYLFSIPGNDLAFSDAGEGMSFGAVQSRGDNPQDILGCVFLKHVYAVFDQGSNPAYGPRLGIAQRS